MRELEGWRFQFRWSKDIDDWRPFVFIDCKISVGDWLVNSSAINAEKLIIFLKIPKKTFRILLKITFTAIYQPKFFTAEL